MSECCSSQKPSKKNSKKQNCPDCGQACQPVALQTIFHHISQPWTYSLEEGAYFFCHNPDCKIVYFGANDSTIEKNALRTLIGIKEVIDTAPICFCFGIDRQTAQSDSQAKAFVVEQTKNGVCSCSTHNPAGRCCLKDFP
jgi:hypothetical protein